jgi:hypothetical protein
MRRYLLSGAFNHLFCMMRSLCILMPKSLYYRRSIDRFPTLVWSMIPAANRPTMSQLKVQN